MCGLTDVTVSTCLEETRPVPAARRQCELRGSALAQRMWERVRSLRARRDAALV